MMTCEEYLKLFPPCEAPLPLELLQKISEMLDLNRSTVDILRRSDVNSAAVLRVLARSLYHCGSFWSYKPDIVPSEYSVPLAMTSTYITKTISNLTTLLQDPNTMLQPVPPEIIEDTVKWCALFIIFLWKQFRLFGGTDEDLILP